MRVISGPRPVRFRLHVDHLSNPKRDVWALQFRRRYLTLRRVAVRVPVETVFRGASARQPRAFLTGRGAVALSTDKTAAVIA